MGEKPWLGAGSHDGPSTAPVLITPPLSPTPFPLQAPTRDGLGAHLRDKSPRLDHLHLQLPVPVSHADVDIA